MLINKFTFPETFKNEYGWSSKTVESYNESVNAFLFFINKDKIKKEDILAYKAHLQSQQCRNGTIKLRLAGVHMYCIFKEMHDLAALFKKIKYQKEIPCVTESKISEEVYVAVRKFLRHEQRYRDVLITDLLYWTGARVSEVLALRLSCFNTGRKRITMAQTKTGIRHEAKLTAEIAQSLSDYEHNAEIKDALFLGVSRHAVDKMLRRVLKKLGFAEQSAHKFRHHRITEWGKKYPLQLVQVQSGHKSLETLKRYIHLSLDDVDKYDATRQGELVAV